MPYKYHVHLPPSSCTSAALHTQIAMAWFTFNTRAFARSYTPTAADKLLKQQQQRKYVKDLWIILASIVAFLTVIRTLRFIFSVAFPPRPAVVRADSTTDLEKKVSADKSSVPAQPDKISITRLPAAFASTFRIVAFRLNIPIGPGAVATVAELSFIFGYIALSFVLTMINSMPLS